MPKRIIPPLSGARLLVSQALEREGIGMAEVSLSIGQNSTYLQQWIRYGAPAKLPEGPRLALAQRLRIDERDLRDSAVLDRIGTRQHAITNDDLPVYAAVECGEGEMHVVSEAIRYITRPEYVRRVDTAYAVVVTGESMSPVHEPGDIVIINPKLPPVPNRDAIFVSEVTGGDFKAVLKRLVRSTPTHWIVRQFNPEAELQLPKKAWRGFKVAGKEYP